MERLHLVMNSRPSDELLSTIMNCSPRFFERLVIDLLLAMGYGGSAEEAAEVIGGSGDEGIDGIIKEDRLGLDTIYVQAKRWKEQIGRPEIQNSRERCSVRRPERVSFSPPLLFQRMQLNTPEGMTTRSS